MTLAAVGWRQTGVGWRWLTLESSRQLPATRPPRSYTPSSLKRQATPPPAACPRAGWVSMLLLEWLRKQRYHPAQGRAGFCQNGSVVSQSAPADRLNLLRAEWISMLPLEWRYRSSATTRLKGPPKAKGLPSKLLRPNVLPRRVGTCPEPSECAQCCVKGCGSSATTRPKDDARARQNASKPLPRPTSPSSSARNCGARYFPAQYRVQRLAPEPGGSACCN